MALTFIIGGSGCGKTEWVYQHILKQAQANRKKNFYMIVPEQFTMQTQKALVEKASNHAILNIDVVSFDRLAYRVFDELGRTDFVVLEDTGKNLILRKLAEDCKDELVTLKNQIHRISYVDQIKSLISEFMQYGIEPEDLESYLDRCKSDSALYYKLKDMHLLYQAFDRYLREGYVTSERILDVLAKCVAESELLKDAVFYFDGFTGFTPVQMKLVRELLRVAQDCFVTVTIDETEELYADKGMQELFYMSRKMVRGVAKLTKEVGCEIAKPVLLDASIKGRFCNNPALSHLEKYLFRPGAIGFEEQTDAIGLYSVASPKEELTFAATTIRKMIREHGYRYQDFAIVSGNVAGYEKYAKEIFALYDIPYFADVKETIYYHPFTEWVRAFLEMVKTDCSYDSVFRYLRCGLSGFTFDEIDLLDNYALERGIRGFKKWNKKWVHPTKTTGRGIKKTEEEKLAGLLALNELRMRMIAQIAPVFEVVQAGKVNVSTVTKAIYEVMVALDIQQQLKEKKEYYEEAGKEYLAATYGQIYKIVIDLFDKVVDLLGKEEMPIEEYAQILDAGFLAAKVGTIPPGADCVILGDIERTRLGKIKVLIFMGVNDGIIPKVSDRKNLLSQYDRECMAKDHMELAPTTREQVFLQKFYLYLNMTKPEDALIITYARMDHAGAALKPSYLVNTMKQLFTSLEETVLEADFAEDMMTAKSSNKQYVKGLLKAQKDKPDKDWLALHQWRMGQPEYQEDTKRLLETAFYVYKGTNLTPELAKQLYGSTLYNSVSRLEQYFKCAYAHFLKYGLKLSERPEYSFASRDLGDVFHNSMDAYCKGMKEAGCDWFTVTEDKQKELLTQAVSDTLLAMDTSVLADSARNQYMTIRITNILERSVWALTKQIRKGVFVPVAYEQNFYEDIDLELSETSDARMVLNGRIDRIDVYENDQQMYVKIMDYKSGKKKFDLSHIYHGQDLQLALYMHNTIASFKKKQTDEHGSAKDIIPAGMLYYQMDDPSIDGAKVVADQVEQKVFEALCPTGLINSDQVIIDKFDQEILEKKKSDVIPIGYNKDGSLNSNSQKITASRERFDILDQFVMGKLKEAGREILEGQIAPAPIATSDLDGCEWCDYKEICGFDERIPGYKRKKGEVAKDIEELWNLIEEKGAK